MEAVVLRVLANPVGILSKHCFTVQGEIVWSRVYVMEGRLHVDLGRATSVSLPEAETERRWKLTTPQWPMMHCVLHGVTRDQVDCLTCLI